jgi:tRNA-Thr(GGU) m(6)t(6)A37 methyltransferase TsaA
MASKTKIILRPVGFVRRNESDDEVRMRATDAEARIEISHEFEEALDGLQGFSHIFVLSYLNKLRPDQIGPLKVKPRRLLSQGFKPDELPLVGVFAIDSPTRPNPIGLTLVRLVRIDGSELVVRGLDVFDGTPVLDIKPYRGNYRTDNYEVARWYRDILTKTGEDV